MFAHLMDAETGLITLLGFGSLVSEISARQSFEFKNFRLGTCIGAQRIFNRADWINIDWGEACRRTAEVCSLAVMRSADPQMKTRVSLMDVTATDGLSGFLERESTYSIIEVPFKDDTGAAGVALACGECSDDESERLWGANNWYLLRRRGRISYSAPEPFEEAIPLVPLDCASNAPLCDEGAGYPQRLDPAPGEDVYELPAGPWVYPSPGYLRLCFHAHRRAGEDVSENFLDTTLLMDRRTTLRTYLDANPALAEYVFDPRVHPEWASDQVE